MSSPFPPPSSGILSFILPPLASSICQLLFMWFYQLLAFGGFCPRKAVKVKKRLFCSFLLRVFCWTIFRYISVQFSHSVISNSLWLHGLQHARLPCPSPTPGGCSNSCPSGQWCHPTISSTVVSFSSCLLSFPASGSFPMSQFFASGGQSIGASTSAWVLPINIQDWFPLGWTGWISLQSKGLSRVFSNTTVQKHKFFCAKLSLLSNHHIHTWLLEKP